VEKFPYPSKKWDDLHDASIAASKDGSSTTVGATRFMASLMQYLGRCLPWYDKKESFNKGLLTELDSMFGKANKKITAGSGVFKALLGPLGLDEFTFHRSASFPKFNARRWFPRGSATVQASLFPHEVNTSSPSLRLRETELVRAVMGSDEGLKVVSLGEALEKRLTNCEIVVHRSSRTHVCQMEAKALASAFHAALPCATLSYLDPYGSKEHFAFTISCPCCELKKDLKLPKIATPAPAIGGGGGGGGGAGAEEFYPNQLVNGKVQQISFTAKDMNEFFKANGLGDCMGDLKTAYCQAAANTPGFSTFTCSNEKCKYHEAPYAYQVTDTCIKCLDTWKESKEGYLHVFPCPNSKCKLDGCAICGKSAESHVGGFCVVPDEETLHRSRGEKQCPGCKVWTEKNDGCRHMSCVCGSHWCWEHEEAWEKGWQGMGHDRLHGSYECPGYEAQLAAASSASAAAAAAASSSSSSFSSVLVSSLFLSSLLFSSLLVSSRLFSALLFSALLFSFSYLSFQLMMIQILNKISFLSSCPTQLNSTRVSLDDNPKRRDRCGN
jgi:hypothetical protein